MKELKSQFKKILQNLPWERDVKSWDWDSLIPENFNKLNLNDFQEQIALNSDSGKRIAIDYLENYNEALQNKIYKNLNKKNKFFKIDLLQKIKAKTDLVINIPAKAEMTINFANLIFSYWANLYFVIGADAKVTILDRHHVDKDKFGAGSVIVLLGKNSEVDYGVDTNDKANYHFDYNFICTENAQVRVFALNNIQAKHHFHSIDINHYDNTSHGEITWLIDAQTNSKSVFYLANNHFDQNTTGDMLIKALGRDKSQVKIDGWINISKKAFNTNSYLQEDTLLLSEDVNIKAEPNLEILNNDVKASHGATVTSVDEQQFLYLQSRGLSKLEAEKIITVGFLKASLNRIKSDFLLKYFRSKY